MRSNLLLLAALANAAMATYILKDDYQPENFFDMFNFFDAPDPTYGYVHYLDRSVAQKQGLISTDKGTVYMGVDSKEIASGRGRKSVRIETKKTYEGGLIAIDVKHMPGGICGAWPAFWSVGPNWPEDGEVDIIEGINSRDYNLMALHTMDGCVIERSENYKAVIETDNCYIKAPGQGDNQGCAFNDHTPNTFGKGFNEIGGGVYATEWKKDVVNIWFFPRGEIPEDLNTPNPDPTKWGIPNAQFKGTCEFDKLLKKQRFIFNTALCGGWTVSQWASDPVCSSKAPTCEEFVKNNPEAFEEAFWEITYMKVFQEGVLPEPEPSPKPEPKPTPKPEPEPKPEPTPEQPKPEEPEPPVEEPKLSSSPEPTKPAPSPAPEPKPTGDKPVPSPPSQDKPAPSGSCTPKPVTTSCTTYVTTITETIVRTIPIDENKPTPAARHVHNHVRRRHH